MPKLGLNYDITRKEEKRHQNITKCKINLTLSNLNHTFIFITKNIIVMKSNFLFPNSFKTPGLVLFTLGLVLGIMVMFFDFSPSWLDINVISLLDGGLFQEKTSLHISNDNITDEIAAIMLIIGSLFLACSKEKNEDEFISKLRLDSLLVATYVNYALLAFAIIFIYGLPFLNVIVFNMFTLLIIFIIRFQYVLYKNSKSAEWAID